MSRDDTDPICLASDKVIEFYEQKVTEKYKDAKGYWPVISGHNRNLGSYQDYWIFSYIHTGSNFTGFKYPREFLPELIGTSKITNNNISSVRRRIEDYYRLKKEDAVFVIKKDMSNLDSESVIIMEKHEFALGIVSMKIFLSHKGIDKPRIRDFKETLTLLGFDPWLDEDAMIAGTELERGLLQGFKDSCAAVFFITPNFKDENYLSSEINYAIQEKRDKGDKFSIITLVFEENNQQGQIPDLLKTYVWKKPKTDLEALREILLALPIKVGNVVCK